MVGKHLPYQDGSISEYVCPSSSRKSDNNYVAIIGPGTAWREDKRIRSSELPDGGSHTVMLLEMLNPDKKWGEPDSITVDELLMQLKTLRETSIMSNHPLIFHVLLADGSVWRLPSDMPIALWQKLLAGNVKNIEELKKSLDASTKSLARVAYPPSDYDRFLTSLKKTNASLAYAIEKGPTVCAFLVWLFSLFLLFRRAIKSRAKPETESSQKLDGVPAN